MMTPSHGFFGKSDKASARWEHVTVMEFRVSTLARPLWMQKFYIYGERMQLCLPYSLVIYSTAANGRWLVSVL